MPIDPSQALALVLLEAEVITKAKAYDTSELLTCQCRLRAAIDNFRDVMRDVIDS